MQEIKIGDFGLAAQLEFDGERKLYVVVPLRSRLISPLTQVRSLSEVWCNTKMTTIPVTVFDEKIDLVAQILRLTWTPRTAFLVGCKVYCKVSDENAFIVSGVAERLT